MDVSILAPANKVKGNTVVSEHRYGIHKGNLKYPMAKHYPKAKHKSHCTLEVSGIEWVSCGTSGEDKAKHLKQSETYWINMLKAIIFPVASFGSSIWVYMH